MKLQNISFKHHRVLGDTTIYLTQLQGEFKNDEVMNYDDMVVTTSPSDVNTYTYLIGENGVGKTVLFKSIVDYSNSFIWDKNPNVDQYYSLIDDGQLVLRRNRGFNELFYDYNILNFMGAKTSLRNEICFLFMLVQQ